RDRLAVLHDVSEHRGRGVVVIPDPMMDVLKMPFPLSGLQIDADETLGEQVVAWPVAAVEVRRRRLDGQVHESAFFVDGDLRPHAGIAVDGPRLVLPGVVAELAGTRNRVERPEQLAGL